MDHVIKPVSLLTYLASDPVKTLRLQVRNYGDAVLLN